MARVRGDTTADNNPRERDEPPNTLKRTTPAIRLAPTLKIPDAEISTREVYRSASSGKDNDFEILKVRSTTSRVSRRIASTATRQTRRQSLWRSLWQGFLAARRLTYLR